MLHGNLCGLCERRTELFTPRNGPVPATYRCTVCGLVQVRFAGKPEETAWRRLYADHGRYHSEFVLKGYSSFDHRLAHDLRLARVRMENLGRFTNEGRLLDVGCSNGALVRVASVYGFFAVGIDPDAWAVEEARQRMPRLNLLPLSFESFAQRDGNALFRVVTFIDSFEHMTEPHQVMEGVRRVLAPKGLLVLEMPDADCPMSLQRGARWKHFKPLEHAFMWGRRHVEGLLSDHKFKLIDTIVPYPDRRAYYARAPA